MTRKRRSSPPSSEALFRLFVEHVKEYAIFAMDRAGRIVYWNAGATHVTGYEEADVLGRTLHEIFLDEDVEAGLPELELETAARTGRAADERWHRRKDGSRFWALGVVTPILDDGGNLIGYGKILGDRTDLKQLQEALERQNAALRRADQHKDHFLAMLAHELRTPQEVLANSARLLQRYSPDDPQVRDVAAMIERQVRYTSRLVDDLMDLSRSRQGHVQLQRRLIDLRSVAHAAIDAVRSAIEARQQALSVAIAERPIEVLADPDRLHQVLVNLLNNANRYTQAGGTIGVTLGVEGGEAVTRISDTGYGIPPEQLADIFELFSQAHGERIESQAGLGIGLALVRELVTLHEGTVQARSEGVGKGSEFIVRLPCADSSGRSPAS